MPYWKIPGKKYEHAPRWTDLCAALKRQGGDWGWAMVKSKEGELRAFEHRKTIALLSNESEMVNEMLRSLVRGSIKLYEWEQRSVLVKALVKAGANVNAQDGDGRTPLHWAAERQSDPEELLRVLLDAGASAETRDGAGRTPLEIAKVQGGPGLIAVLREFTTTTRGDDPRKETGVKSAETLRTGPILLQGTTRPTRRPAEEAERAVAKAATDARRRTRQPRAGPSADRDALMALYQSAGGTSWTRSGNWGTDAPVRDWWGVQVDQDRRVVELRLHNNDLQGPIPPELGDLGNLKVLRLDGNELSGSIPRDLGNLIQLKILDLENNGLTGRIPPELGRLVHLEKLFLRNNGLTGIIPWELGGLGSVKVLWLDGNELTGSIPPELSILVHLENLDLANNGLTGPVPRELGGLSNLKVLWLRGNGLTGPIPAELGRLAHLEELVLDGNELTGTIPRKLGDLAQLEVLDLENNGLTGPIPRELGGLGSLKSLWLRGNGLTGPIPPELGQLANLEKLVLTDNKLTGPVPPEFARADLTVHIDDRNKDWSDRDALMALYGSAGGRAWTGRVENWGTNAPLRKWAGVRVGIGGRVTELVLKSDALRGTIPPELSGLTQLTKLVLRSGNLRGAIPCELGSLAKLERLDLRGNSLEGAIPVELSALGNLTELCLAFNNLAGPIPPELGSLAQLERLHLSRNKLTGPIPAELGGLSNLERLHLSHNKLTGPLPSELGRLARLEHLHLDNNLLTGTVPKELGTLAKLKSRRLNPNRFRGPVPRGPGLRLKPAYVVGLALLLMIVWMSVSVDGGGSDNRAESPWDIVGSVATEGKLTPGESFVGWLSSSDAAGDDGSHFDVWELFVPEGQSVVIQMESDDFDAYLRVVEFNQGVGSVTASDDDGGSGSNARVKVTAPTYGGGGLYYVMATSYRRGTGSYLLSRGEESSAELAASQEEESLRLDRDGGEDGNGAGAGGFGRTGEGGGGAGAREDSVARARAAAARAREDSVARARTAAARAREDSVARARAAARAREDSVARARTAAARAREDSVARARAAAARAREDSVARARTAAARIDQRRISSDFGKLESQLASSYAENTKRYLAHWRAVDWDDERPSVVFRGNSSVDHEYSQSNQSTHSTLRQAGNRLRSDLLNAVSISRSVRRQIEAAHEEYQWKVDQHRDRLAALIGRVPGRVCALQIDVNPSDARVYINNVRYGTADEFAKEPGMLIPSGTFTVRLERAGYQSHEESVRARAYQRHFIRGDMLRR